MPRRFLLPLPASLLSFLLLAGALVPAGAADAASPSSRELSRFDLLSASPGVVGGALGGLVNPAGWSLVPDAEFAFWWNDREVDFVSDRWGFAFGSPFGFSGERVSIPGGPRYWDWQIGFSGGTDLARLGLAYRWATGSAGEAGRENGVALGLITRDTRRLSFGATGFFSAESSQRTGVFDLGLRPLGTSWLTLFADWSLTDAQRIGDGDWTAGAQVRFARLVHVSVRLREAPGGDDLEAAADIGIALNRTGFHVRGLANGEGDTIESLGVVRLGTPHRGYPLREKVAASVGAKRWEVVDLGGRRLGYEEVVWFDRGRESWLDLVRSLERARRDPAVGGVIVNLAGARIRPSLLWELRTELERFREEGKTVAVHIERASTGTYWVASVADRLSMDPRGRVLLPGVALRRTYWAGLLEKAGIGFQELRYYDYKSLNETWSRTDMSERDREQYARVVDVLYEEFRRGITEGRGLSTAAYDAIVDEQGILDADTARERGLVDVLGRWPDLTKWAREQRGMALARTRPDRPVHPDERWGPIPVVSLVWADGVCELDSGIRGRATSEYLRRAARRGEVAAVVLRADSPGGDPLPADLVAEGLERATESGKPVIVTQGDTAASGGYRISLPGQTVYTTPLTMTGSIGVAAGWAWDEGFGDKIGASSDGVQRGRHADLRTGLRLPLGFRLPVRGLTEEEEEVARRHVEALYDDFVGAVSDARGLTDERVREIAEGRVWMGEDAVERGLCDATGTLGDALREARERAGLTEDDEWRLEEFPPRELFVWPSFGPEIPYAGRLLASLLPGPLRPGEAGAEPYALEYFRMLAESPGEPFLLVPPDWLPEEWTEPRETGRP